MRIGLGSLAGASCLLLAIGCGDDGGPENCGNDLPDGVVSEVTLKSEAGEDVGFGNFISSPNNDCTPEGASVTSLTIEGHRLVPADSIDSVVLCLPKPDAVGTAALNISDQQAGIQLVDLFVTDDECTHALDRTSPPQGTVTFSGFCDNGEHDGGYVIAFDAAIMLKGCAEGDPAIPATLVGQSSVGVLGLVSSTKTSR